jgi:hypothetical protein
MSFSADWLALREPYDSRARNGEVLEAVAALFERQRAMAIVDLACGTGSTLRALAPYLPLRQNWRLVDNNLSLLARAADGGGGGVRVTTTPIDLARDLELALDGAVDLVTTSALLDLVSHDWLERLAVEAAARRLPLYAALSYDGRVEFTPADRFDNEILAAFNAHQRRDKGFGPALGPDAANEALAMFARIGYATRHGESDWQFAPDDRDIQTQTLAGFATAASEMDVPAADVEAWLSRRGEWIAAGRSSMRIGHVDFLAWPTGAR